MLVLLQFCALTGLGQSTRAIDLVGDTPEDVFLRLIRDGDAERIQTMLLTTSLPLGLDGEYPYECIRTALLFEHGPIAVELINSIIAHNPEMSQGTHFDSDEGTTLLKTSLATGQSEAFKKLWEEGARTTVNSAAYFRELFLTDDVEFMIVLENLGFSPMEWQEGHGSRRYPITFWAAQYGARQIVNRMLELGADPSETTNSGLSLFFVAILSGSSELVADLSRRGADVNAKWMSFSPLSLAALMGNAKIVDVLLGAGADPSLDANAIAYSAMARGDKEMVERLTRLGAAWDGISIIPKAADRKLIHMPDEYQVREQIQLDGESWMAQRDKGSIRKLPDNRQSRTVAVFYDQFSADLASLFEVELSKVENLDLVERNKIDLIAKEYEIDLLKPETAKFNPFLALIPAEYSLVIQSQRSGPTSGTGEISFFTCEWIALETGVVLGSWLIPAEIVHNETELKTLFHHVSRKIEAHQPREVPVLLGLNRFRPTNTRTESLQISNEFNLLLRSRLVGEGYHVIDQEGIAHVLLEQSLNAETATERNTRTWSIEGGVSLTESEDFTARIRMSPASGTPIDSEFQAPDLQELVNQVSAYIQDNTFNVPEQRFQPKQEARLLYSQSRWAESMGFFQQSIHLADGAWALSPDDSQLITRRLKARHAYLETLYRKFLGARNGKGIVIMGRRQPYGYYHDLDPLNWYDFGISEKQLLSLLDETYRLFSQIVSRNPSAIFSSNSNRIQSYLDVPTVMFTWFTPLHIQNSLATDYQYTKKSGAAAYRHYMNALSQAKASPSRQPVSAHAVEHLGYFFEEGEMLGLCEKILSYCDTWEVPFPMIAEGLSLIGDRGILGRHPRPAYPYNSWKRVIEKLTTSDESIHLDFGEYLSLSLVPFAQMRGSLEKWVALQLERELSEKELLALNNLVRRNSRGPGTSGDGKEHLYIHPGFRAHVIRMRDPLFQANQFSSHPGYNFFYKDQAEKILKQYEDPKNRPATNFFRDAATVFLETLSPEDPEPLSEVSAQSLFAFERFITIDDPAKKIWLARRPEFTEHSIWFFHKVKLSSSGQDFRSLHRFDRDSRRFEEFEVPSVFRNIPYQLQGRIGLAENGTHVLLTDAGAGRAQNGSIHLYDKSTKNWRRFEYLEGTGDGSVFAVKDGFIFLAQRGQRHSRPGYLVRSREENMVMMYRPETDELETLAHNLKTPADYPFESPELFFRSLALSEDQTRFSVYTQPYDYRKGGERIPNGSVSLESGAWKPGAVAPHRYPIQPYHTPNLRGESFDSQYGGLNGELTYKVGKRKEATYVRIQIDRNSVAALAAVLPLSVENQSEVVDEFFEFSDPRALTEVDSRLMRYTNYSVIFFDIAEVEDALLR